MKNMKESVKSWNEQYMKGMSAGKGIMGQAGKVESIPTMTEDQDMSRVREYSCGDKGYSSKAFDYKY